MTKRLAFAAMALACATCMATAASATTIYSNNFSSNDTGFSGNSALTSSGSSANQFLYFGGAGGTGTLTLSGLAADSAVTLVFDLYAVGSLDGDGAGGAPIEGGGNGDYFTVLENNGTSTQIYNTAFCNYGGGEVQGYPTEGSACASGASTTNALGYSGFPTLIGVQDAEYDAITLDGTASSLGAISFTFEDNSNEGAGNEFYGIDNVSVTGTLASVSPPPTGVPEPITISIFGAGVAGIAAVRRRKKIKQA